MDPRRFDALTKALVRNLPRRGLLVRLGGAGLVALAAGRGGGRVLAQEVDGKKVELFCEPCQCEGDNCKCCLSGITGGGVVQVADGEAQFVLFASRLDANTPDAAGFVRWIDLAAQGSGLTLESVGPITYDDVPEVENTREIRGTMQANGSGQYPFALKVFDAGPDQLGKDTANLAVGDKLAEGGTGSGFGYAADGPIIGGDLQLLGNVAPVPGA